MVRSVIYSITKHILTFALTLLVMLIGIIPVYSMASDTEAKYNEYLESHIQVSPGSETAVIKASEFEKATGADVIDGFLLTKSDSAVTYRFTLPEDGLYNIALTYKAVAGGSEIIRRIIINDSCPFKEAEYITLKRYYRDKDTEYKNQQGNQSFPAQVETEVWKQAYLSSADGYITEPFIFFFKSGVNTLTIESVESDIWLDTISLIPAKPLVDYKSYLEECLAKGYEKYDGDPIKIQAEDASLKTSPSLYPINDRTSPLTEPYHPSYIVLNAIGGYAWRFPGQAIEWTVEVPKTGLYKLAFKYKQSYVRGVFSTRKLLINGVVPFREANDLRFEYSTKFSTSYLSDRNTGEEFLFLLNEGTNTICLEASLGVFGSLVSRVEESLNNLNRIYQDIIVITSTSPDKYRDYKLNTLIPDLNKRLAAERDALKNIVDEINTISGSFSSSTSIINMLIVNIERILDKPNKIGSYLADFKQSMSSLGDWIVSIQQQPMEIDYFILAADGTELPRAEAGFFQKVLHSIRAFFGSFTTKFNSSSAMADKSSKTIEVWVSTGRDQYDVLRRLINESFSKESNINVNLKLVNADAVFPASLTGNGPDVNIQVNSSIPVNFGYRDGAYDLTEFPDFEEVASRFAPAAVETFRFRDACFALPDQMSFNVMFYRTDIFEELNLEVPQTMHDFLAIVPVLQKNQMDIYFTTGSQTALGASATTGSTRNINPVYVSFLYQNGGQLYRDDGAATDITSDAGINAFKYWTELYTKHNFIVQTDFATRFRMGEIPVGIVDFTLFNTLSVAAPEIKGKWAMARIPGTLRDGEVYYDTPVTVSGSLIVKNIAEKKGTLEESWEFLKWWTSEETQYNFAIEMESVLGLAGRYPVANLNAFFKLPWGKNNLQVLKDSLQSLRAVPQVPGSYITGRSIENAFLSVVTETTNLNPTDAIYKAADQINTELKNKRKEFRIE
ncbi:MAG TPA: extracellular solute-binding protein [Clostridiales bacterium]|nr:extracellular solute-binding protein [Clostridiales bacterium]